MNTRNILSLNHQEALDFFMKSERFAKYCVCVMLNPFIDKTCVVIALLSLVPANPIVAFFTETFFEIRESTSVTVAFSLQQTNVTNDWRGLLLLVFSIPFRLYRIFLQVLAF